MEKLRGSALEQRRVSTRMRGASYHARGRIDSGHQKEISRAHESTQLSRIASFRQKREDEMNLIKCREDNKIQVSLKHLNQSIFVFVHNVNSNSPYRIENRSLDYVIYFRQWGCENHQ